jgi:hypothetical protein
MSEYAARLKNNIVEDVIVANYQWAIENIGGEWVDCTSGDKPCAGLDFTYDPVTKTFTGLVSEVTNDN